MAKMPKNVLAFLSESKMEFTRFMNKRADLIEKGVVGRANVPGDYRKRVEVANRCARLHFQRNRSDPFAAARARSSVLHGILGEEDYNAGNIAA